jgi:excinuclease ABC subunit C
MFDIKEELKKLPDSPGVYLHKDEFGQIIYVGKAVSLRRRVSQYFQSKSLHDAKTRELVKHIAEFEYINCGSEMEALILECNLIKKHRPKYNILLRDDKTYPYIKVTVKDEFPRVLKTRRLVNDGSKYFGPYADVTSVNSIIDLLNSVYALKRCGTRKFTKDFRPCLNYHIHECRGVCTGKVSPGEYSKSIESVLNFLQGKSSELKRKLKADMDQASGELRYEDAARHRDHLSAIHSLSEKQRVVLSKAENLDIILLVGGFAGEHALLFTVREGKLLGRESFFLGERTPDMLSEFIKRYYFENVMIPKEILVAKKPEDHELLQEWLSAQRASSSVSINMPVRGEKKALMDAAKQDAEMMLKDIDERAHRRKERDEKLTSALCDVFGAGLGKKLRRIESYDVSGTFGTDSVGAMVVFEDGRPLKKAYRRFKINTARGADDTGSLQEVLFRRFSNAKEKTPGFETLPDAVFMDGGAAQVNAAKDVLNALKLDVPVAGMVKDEKHRSRALLYNGVEYGLKDKPELFSYVGSIQEEVHRFALEYHRSIRRKSVQRSDLDNIPGVGPRRRAQLLSRFGSIENIRKAEKYELEELVGSRVAEEIVKYYQK